MRLQVYCRFGDWLDNNGKIDKGYLVYNSPITKPVHLIYDSWDPDKNKKLINGNLHMEDSAAGSLEFSVSRKHPFYSKFCNILLDTVYVVVDGLLIWDGRPTKMDIDWNGTKTIYFEGALSYLNDQVLNYSSRAYPGTLYQFITNGLIPSINVSYSNRSPDSTDTTSWYINDRMFYPTGSIVVDELGETYYWNPNYETCMEWLKTYIIGNFQARCKIVYPKDAVNAYLLRNKPIPRYLCIINNFKNKAVAAQTPTKYIDFGKNMLSYSYSKEIDENFCTDYIGRGETIDDTTGREMKRFIIMDPSGNNAHLKDAAIHYKANLFYSDLLKDQMHYGLISKTVDFSSVKRSNILWGCVREKYRIVRRSPYKETIVISGADIEPAEPADRPTQNTPKLDESYYDEVLVATANTNISTHKYLIYRSPDGDSSKSTWPLTFKYHRCHPTYFDLWTRVIAKSKPHFVGSKTWYITGIDLSFDNPLTPDITMENNAKGLTDEYIQNGARIGDVAGAFQPSSDYKSSDYKS